MAKSRDAKKETKKAPQKTAKEKKEAKRAKKVGFRTRSKTAGGRKVIKRKIKRSGKFRVG